MDLPFSSAADRNKAAILSVLQHLLPPSLRVLEIAAGSGQHACHFAQAHAGWVWQASDADPAMPRVIDARCAGIHNILPALHLDVLRQPWPLQSASLGAIYCANMLHISPWATCAALMQGAVMHLEAKGLLILYGPFRQAGAPTAPSNEAFDAQLKAQNPAWGLRELSDVTREAHDVGLSLQDVIAMPANNLLVVFQSG